MFAVLSHPVFARLFAAQLVALLGTGLLTVALGLLAFEIAGAQAGAVLGIAYAIKMIAYVGLAPIAGAAVERLPRKAVLVAADLVRAAVALALPFIDAAWQIYALIFVLQAASATFTPAFQATIPDVLPQERDYTRALSLSRLAYDTENLVSPLIAGALLSVMSYHWLFGGTFAGFALSAALVLSASLPAPARGKTRRFVERLTRGARIYLATPRLRGLLGVTLSAAAASAFVLVNTVVIVRAGLGRGDVALAQAMAAYGAGSMVVALALPRVLDTLRDRAIMLGAAFALALLLLIGGWRLGGGLEWPALLVLWAGMGALYSAILTPAGRLLRRSAHPEDRPFVYAAQFALSHACWLVTYPMAGWLGGAVGMPATMAIFAVVALLGALGAWRLWPAASTSELEHSHDDLPPDHPHLRAHPAKGGRHTHVFTIDDEHHAWPRQG